MTRRVLMIAYHYPPCSGSSGVLRALKFSRYLPEHGWQPIVLTAHSRAYPETNTTQLVDIPAEATVARAFAVDTARHLSIRGAYPRLLALPDRWSSWWFGGVAAGLRLIRATRPAVMWSTFPIATAHLIGLTLHRLTGIPWVADFRDPMTEDNYPVHALTRGVLRRIEGHTVANAVRLVFTTGSTLRLYEQRYPHLASERKLVIPNGYDEADFAGLVPSTSAESSRAIVRLLHAGLIYQEERDPRTFFLALARLLRDGKVSPASLRIDLRGSGSDGYYGRLIREFGIEPLVNLLPALPYRRALGECAEATALLLLQGASCNRQIPAKAYEYLRLRKPILALAAPDGDTAALLRETGGATIMDLADADAIYSGLPGFLASVRAGVHPLPDPLASLRYSRHNHAQTLAACFSGLMSSGRYIPTEEV